MSPNEMSSTTTSGLENLAISSSAAQPFGTAAAITKSSCSISTTFSRTAGESSAIKTRTGGTARLQSTQKVSRPGVWAIALTIRLIGLDRYAYWQKCLFCNPKMRGGNLRRRLPIWCEFALRTRLRKSKEKPESGNSGFSRSDSEVDLAVKLAAHKASQSQNAGSEQDKSTGLWCRTCRDSNKNEGIIVVIPVRLAVRQVFHAHVGSRRD